MILAVGLAVGGGQRTLTIALFVGFVVATLLIVVRTGRGNTNTTDFYSGGRSMTGMQNGIAISGDYLSAASFLGIAGIIALSGYDGLLYSVGFLVAWLVALLLVAEMMRNSGRYTMADVLAFRMRQRPVRMAAGISTIVVSIFYLIAQMVGAGALVSLLFGVNSQAAKDLTIVAVGVLMIFYVMVGGMTGTSWVQIIKAVLLMTGTTLLTVLVLAHYGLSVSALLGAAADGSGRGQAFLNPGLRYGTAAQGAAGKLDLLSLGVALVLGTAGLPHILTRFYTVPDSRAARRSVLWAIGIIGSFYLMTIALGFGAAALVGSNTIAAQSPSGNTAAPQLAQAVGRIFFGETGGTIVLALIGAVAFATILAVVAGLTLASSTSFAHDIYAQVLKRGDVKEYLHLRPVRHRRPGGQEIKVARWAALVIGAVSIVLSIYVQKLNVAFLVALAFAMAASGNLPAILYSLFWRRFNTTGAVSAIYGGLLSAITLVVLSPVVSGQPAGPDGRSASLITDPSIDFHLFPLENPGLVSIPLGFLFGWLGTVLSSEHDPAGYAELEVRALTGAGAEKATDGRTRHRR